MHSGVVTDIVTGHRYSRFFCNCALAGCSPKGSQPEAHSAFMFETLGHCPMTGLDHSARPSKSSSHAAIVLTMGGNRLHVRRTTSDRSLVFSITGFYSWTERLRRRGWSR